MPSTVTLMEECIRKCVLLGFNRESGFTAFVGSAPDSDVKIDPVIST
jgi:hypothetical protein